MRFKNLSIATLLLLLSPANSWAQGAPAPAQEAKVIAFQGRVTVNGTLLRELGTIPVGARVETFSGSVSVAIGTDNVMKLGSDSVLRVERISGAQVATFLEKGRLEGVRRIETRSGPRRNATIVQTGTGSMEIPGGRFLVEVSASSTKQEARFVAVDGNARFTADNSAIAPTAIRAGEALLVRPQGPSDRNVASAGPQLERQSVSPAQAAASVQLTENIFVPRTAGQVASGPTSEPNPRPGPILLEPVVSGATPAARDPLQSVNRHPKVTVTVTY